MAQLQQDFIKFEDDYFSIRWTVTDSVNISSYRGLFFMTNNFDSPSGNTLQKRHDNWLTSTSWTCGANAPSVTNLNTSITESGNQFAINASYVDVVITYTDMNNYFPGGTPGEKYYHELVLSSDGDPCKSVVVATGWMEVRTSLFSKNSYR